jgi:hypothetical protein
MISVIKNAVKCLEDHMKVEKYDPHYLSQLNYMFVMKLIDWKDSKFTVYEIIEKSPLAKEFTIRARNNFISYSNCMFH